MLRIEVMSWSPHFPDTDRTSSSPQKVDGVSSSQPVNNTKFNVVQNDQHSTSIGNSTQDSLAWNWNKKSFLSRLVSWIKGDVGFVAYNNKVVVLNTSDDVQKLNNPNGSFEVTDVSFFKRLKAVVWGDELKEVERDFESAKMDAYLSDFFVFCEDLRKSENGINFLSNNFISNLREQISNLEKGMKNLFKDPSIDIDAKLEFKSKLLDDLIKLLDDKFTFKYSSKGMMLVKKDFFNEFNADSLKNLLSLKSRLELYKQATQGHLYQAKMPDGRINYILVDDEEQLNDYQLKNDSKIEFLKVLGENVSLDEKLRFKVEVDDDLTGKTKIIEVPKVMDLIEFQNGLQKGNKLNEDLSEESEIDRLKNAPIWEYLKIDSSKVSALKNWVEYNDNEQEYYIQYLLIGVIQGKEKLSEKVNFFSTTCDDIESKLCLGSMLLYNDEPVYREQNRKLFQLMQKNEVLYDIMLENASVLNYKQWNDLSLLKEDKKTILLKKEDRETILWKMFTAQWRRDFLEGRATILRQ